MNKKNTIGRFPIIKKSRYYNNADDYTESFFFQTIPSFISSLYGRKKRQPENKSDLIAYDVPVAFSREPVVTWIGHATFLIQGSGINILTDPLFGDASFLFPRVVPPGIALQQLPRIDYVVLSHNHRDHCDLTSLRALRKANPHMVLLVPQGDKAWLEKKGFAPIVEHEWWQTYNHEMNEGSVRFSFLPAFHWSGQGLFDHNKSLWGSWMISFPSGSSGIGFDLEQKMRSLHPNQQADSFVSITEGGSEKTIYFAGDTAYADHFCAIAQEYPVISMALMPIAPETPHPWMRKSHMDAQQAVRAFLDLKAHHFIPMHWGTFQFGRDSFHGPLERLKILWLSQAESEARLTIPKVGQRVSV